MPLMDRVLSITLRLAPLKVLHLVNCVSITDRPFSSSIVAVEKQKDLRSNQDTTERTRASTDLVVGRPRSFNSGRRHTDLISSVAPSSTATETAIELKAHSARSGRSKRNIFKHSGDKRPTITDVRTRDHQHSKPLEDENRSPRSRDILSFREKDALRRGGAERTEHFAAQEHQQQKESKEPKDHKEQRELRRRHRRSRSYNDLRNLTVQKPVASYEASIAPEATGAVRSPSPKRPAIPRLALPPLDGKVPRRVDSVSAHSLKAAPAPSTGLFPPAVVLLAPPGPSPKADTELSKASTVSTPPAVRKNPPLSGHTPNESSGLASSSPNVDTHKLNVHRKRSSTIAGVSPSASPCRPSSHEIPLVPLEDVNNPPPLRRSLSFEFKFDDPVTGRLPSLHPLPHDVPLQMFYLHATP